MKQKLSRLSRRYAAALQAHLEQGERVTLLPALVLGRRAVALGLEMLQMARMHESALATFDVVASGKREQGKRGQLFFTEAVAPIIETHRAARENRARLGRLSDSLDKRTRELASSNRRLDRGIIQRKGVETALRKSGARYTRLLTESLALQDRLRQLTHQVLAAQEAERSKISRELRDDIAQTLLGINVRLLTLKSEARVNQKGLKREIASTQRLVAKSARSVRKFAREFRNL
jgi:signal transduction histidine kinase